MSEDSANMILRVRRVTAVGLLVNLLLCLIKGAGGVMYGSQALIADAIHSFSDLATDLALILGVKYWTAPPDHSHPYGHGKIETLVSVFIGCALAFVAVGLISDASSTLKHGGECAPGFPAFIVALISIFVKECLYRWTIIQGRLLDSAAVKANAWHHRSDAISSIPVAVAVAMAYYFPQYKFIDALGAVIVSIFILHAAWQIIRPCLYELSEAGVEEEEEQILQLSRLFPGIMGVHAIRTRRLGKGYFVDMHIMVRADLTVRDGHEIAHRLKLHLLKNQPAVMDVIIHVEPFEKKADRLPEIV